MADLQKIAEDLSGLTVLEASELTKILEEKWGVSAAAPVAVAAAPAGQAGGDAGGAEEKTEFTIHLATAGDKKINVIKVVRTATGLGLKEAKELVDGAPSKIKEAAPKAEAEEIKNITQMPQTSQNFLLTNIISFLKEKIFFKNFHFFCIFSRPDARSFPHLKRIDRQIKDSSHYSLT